jgi:hypothetical protein
LADDDGAGADDEDAFDGGVFGHDEKMTNVEFGMTNVGV